MIDPIAKFRENFRSQTENLERICAEFSTRGVLEGFNAAPTHRRADPPTEDEFAGNYENRNALLCGFMVFVIYRMAGKPPVAAAYYHREYGSLISRLGNRGQRAAMKKGDCFCVPFDDLGNPCPWPTPEAVERAKNTREKLEAYIGKFSTG